MDNWISVKDRLPKNRSGVIGTNGELVGEIWFDKDKFNHPFDVYVDEYDLAFIKSITHWMLLPNPPED